MNRLGKHPLCKIGRFFSNPLELCRVFYFKKFVFAYEQIISYFWLNLKTDIIFMFLFEWRQNSVFKLTQNY